MRLLAKNNREGLDAFHTELELIPLEQHKNIYIKKPIQLEQYMMEGAYNKVLSAKTDVPSEYYTYFMNMLTKTLRFVGSLSFFLVVFFPPIPSLSNSSSCAFQREEVADCMEHSHQSPMKVADVAKLLDIATPSELAAYAQQVSAFFQNTKNTKEESVELTRCSADGTFPVTWCT
jgi:hypothetical protein